jgi:serine protease Do
MIGKRLIASVAILAAVTTATVLFAQDKCELDDLRDSNIHLLENAQKAIVAIHSTKPSEQPSDSTMPTKSRLRKRQQGGTYKGTGAIISSDGYILTSTSVVPPRGTDIKVFAQDGTEYKAVLVGTEERNNVALIKIDATDLPVLSLGSSGDLRVGQFAFSVGNPYDCILNDRQVAFSMGIVSAIYRLRGDGDYYGRVIETDAALHDFSDGGPLLNSAGEIIGVLNMGYSYTKWLNVAVPIDQIKYILDDLKENARVYPYYGFTPDSEEAREGGVEITKTSRGGPARKAGINRGDIILEMDGLRITSCDQLALEMAVLPAGSETTFLIRRGEQEIVKKLTLGKVVEKPGTMGITATEESDHLTITAVAEGGAAEDAGIAVGDRILEINGIKVTKLDEAAAILRYLYPGDKARLVIEREGEKLEFGVTLREKK